jgi:hypothetical protein
MENLGLISRVNSSLYSAEPPKENVVNRQRLAKNIALKIIASCAFAFALIGCAAAPSSITGAAANGSANAPPPDVHDCTLISTGSPSKYACGDHTYTSYDLTKMQRNYGAQQNSGK